MSRTEPASHLLIVTLVIVSMSVVGGVSVVSADEHTDGNRGNGEELRSGQDNEDGLYPINYTFIPDSHKPGVENGAAEHYAEGATENFTLHWVVVRSPHFNFADCSADKVEVFGLDRGNDDSGTVTDDSLLTSYKTAKFKPNSIEIAYYKEEALAGEPIDFYVSDQLVARQRNCYDNPTEPGWYRIQGKLNGSSTTDTKTDYSITDFSDWVYVCDCSSRQEAVDKLGPAPKNSKEAYKATGGGSSGDGDGGGDTTPTPTKTAAESDSEATATTTADGADPSATASKTSTSGQTETGTASPSTSIGSSPANQGTKRTVTRTGTGKQAAKTNGSSGATETAASPGSGGPQTPTIADGPGFGSAVSLLALLLAVAIGYRRR